MKLFSISKLTPSISKFTVSILSVLLLGSFLGSAAFARTKKKPIVIGILAATTSDFAIYGVPVENSAKVAVEQINKRGGINGHKLVLVVEDSQCKPELAINIAHKFADMRIPIVIGGTCSGSTQASLPVFNKAHIVVMSASATAAPLTDGSNPNFFRLIPPDTFQGEFQADFLMHRLKAKTIAILHDKDAYGKGLALALRKTIKGKVKILTFEGITVGAVDYSAVVSKLRSLHPDAIAFEGYLTEGSKLLTQFYKRHLRMPILLPESHKQEVLFNLDPRYRANVYISSPQDPSLAPGEFKGIKPLKRILTKRKQRTTAFGIYAYSLIQIIQQALIQTKGNTSYKAVRKALMKGNFNTIIGKAGFNSKGDIIQKHYIMYRANKSAFLPAK